jgi:hypothetical protein
MNEEKISRERYTPAEDEYIKKNYYIQTHKQIGLALQRTKTSIVERCRELKMPPKKKSKKTVNRAISPAKSREAYVSSLTDDERREFFRKELRNSPLYKSTQSVLSKEELELYVDKYVEFMMDPTIETMTCMEKDALHDLTLAQIRIFRHLKEEKTSMTPDVDGRIQMISRAKEIQACQDVIARAQESLNVQRKQRLKDKNDQAMTFTSVIKELKDPNVRRKVGIESTMFKFMAEKFYNDHIGTNIIAGKDEKFDTAMLFGDNPEPSGLTSNFTG